MNRPTERRLILLVDDEKDIIDSVSEFLKESSFDVIAETDPEKAVRLARHMLVDLVILDLQMPKLDGLEVLRLLREQQPNLKVIILTGQMANFESRIQNVKLDRIILKPPDTRKLLQTVSELTQAILSKPSTSTTSLTPQAKLLLVDDEVEYCEIVSEFLRTYPSAKFEVEFALTGLEGIEKATFFEPDFIMLDWKMPLMLGDEFLKRIGMIEDWTPKQLFIISANALTAQEKALLPPGTIFFQKPFDLEKLCDLICKRCLDLGLIQADPAT